MTSTKKRVYIGASVSPELHQEFSDAMYTIGVEPASLIRYVAEQVVSTGKIPFEIPVELIHRTKRPSA